MTEFVPNNVYSVYFEFANGSHYYLANGYCFAKGTLITLSDGSKKPVEEVSFKDRLKVWNFDDGHEDTADILWISPGGRRFPYYYRCTFSDGTSLNVVGEEGGSCHRIFDRTKGSFVRGHSIDVGDEIYTENGFVTLVSCEKIDEEVEFYNVVTAKHINCFTNGVLTSARYNNRYPIDQNMKFIKDGRKIRPYREFKKVGISRQWYDGMRLGEVQDSVDVVRKYINRSESLGNLNPDWKEPGFFARIWNRIKALFSK